MCSGSNLAKGNARPSRVRSQIYNSRVGRCIRNLSRAAIFYYTSGTKMLKTKFLLHICGEVKYIEAQENQRKCKYGGLFPLAEGVFYSATFARELCGRWGAQPLGRPDRGSPWGSHAAMATTPTTRRRTGQARPTEITIRNPQASSHIQYIIRCGDRRSRRRGATLCRPHR
jgi:hypothetical protein